MLQETTLDKVLVVTQGFSVLPPALTSLLSRWHQPGTCRCHAVAMMSRFPTERVILLFSTIAHVVLHFIQQPNNHPFVRPGGHTRVAMPYAERNTGILQQNFQRAGEPWLLLKVCLQPVPAGMESWFTLVTRGEDFDSERDLWSRAAIVLSPPHTCYHSNREDPSVRRVVLVAVVLVGGWWGVHADKKHK